MKILLAVDGSKYSKKAAAFILANDQLLGDDGEVLLVNVQASLPGLVSKLVGSGKVKDYHREESAKAIDPVAKVLTRHGVQFKSLALVGHPGEQIVAAAKKAGAHMIVMGTHGHGIIGQALIGSVAQRVLGECKIPLLLVK